MLHRIARMFGFIAAFGMAVTGPADARFLQTDPVGYQDDLNLYAYVANDPLNGTDPTGTENFRREFEAERARLGQTGPVDMTPATPAEAALQRGLAVGLLGLTAPAAVGLAPPGAGVAVLANPATITEGIAIAGEIAVPGTTLAGGTAALMSRAGEVHEALDPIAQSMRTTAVVETAEGGRFVGSSANTLSPAQRATLGPGETAARGPGHAEITAANAAEAAGQTPVAVGASRAVCPDCQRELTRRGIRY